MSETNANSFPCRSSHPLSPLKKVVRPLLTFFCLPTYLVALLLLLLLSYNVANIFYLPLPIPTKIKPEPDSFLPERESKETTRRWSSLSTTVMYSVREEHPVSNFNTRLSIVQKTEIFNTSVEKKTRVLSRTRPFLKFLRYTTLSKQFSGRAKEFFHGSSVNSSCKVRFFMTWISSLESFGSRESLSIESVFKSHPNACLLIVSTSMDTKRGLKLLRPFKEQGFRVVAVSPDFHYLFKHTSAEAWFIGLMRGNIDPGEVSLGQNLSNLLRLATLYKFGGIYLDTDVVVLKRLNNLRNVIGAQTMDLETGNWSRLNNAVMIFDKKHPLLYKFIEEFSLTFNGNKWGHNGPYLVSRVVSRLSDRPGFNFSILPSDAFYPVNWNKVQSIFEGPTDAVHSTWVSAKYRNIRGSSYGIHLWNKQSRLLKVEEGSILHRIMLECCIFCNSTASTM